MNEPIRSPLRRKRLESSPASRLHEPRTRPTPVASGALLASPIRAVVTTGLLLVGSSSVAAALPQVGTGGPRLRGLARAASNEPGDRFGRALAPLGDLDGDGRPELLVGAPRANGAGGAAQGVGAVHILSGDGLRPVARLEGKAQWTRFGDAVCDAGDLDGDGRPEIAVGAPYGPDPAGEVQIYSGRDLELVTRLTGRAAGERFGACLANLGDLDGDGRAELAIAAPDARTTGLRGGRVEVRSGADGHVLWEREGVPWDFLGYSIAAAGDVDGDGALDLVVGAPFSDVAAFNGGSAFLYSGLDGQTLGAVHGTGPGDQLGSCVAGGTDVDGDGVPDFATGAPGADAPSIDSGEVRLWSGATKGLLRAFAGSASGEGLFQVCLLSDLDGDGSGEIAVGAASGGSGERGRVRVHSTGDGRQLALFEGTQSRDWLGARLVTLGDLDGDGRVDFAAGAPGHDDEPAHLGEVQVFGWRAP